MVVGLLDGLGVGDGEGVVHGTDLHHDLHLAVLIELLEGVDGRIELAGDGLIGNLQGTDVLEALHGDLLADVSLLVEFDGSHDVAVQPIDQTADRGEQDDFDDNFSYFVHFMG